MAGTDKTIVHAVAAACILGIIIVGALVLTNHTTPEGFSELYFNDPDTFPSMINVGEKIDFAFTIVSHEKKQTAYDYNVTYDGHSIRSGSFSLEPTSSTQYKKTIKVSITPSSSSLVRMTDLVVNQSRMRYNAALGTVSSRGSNFDRIDLITSPNGYSLISWGMNDTAKQIDINTPGKFILPLRLQIDSISDGVGLLIFDPKQKQSYNRSFRTIIPEGSQEDIVPSDGPSLSNLGYTIRRDDWNIVNERGNIDILHKNSITTFRYAFKKVSVKVSSAESEIHAPGETAKPAVSDMQAGSEYEIHFWILVKEDPDKVQSM